ncbi:hypothetical protein HZB04_02130 [Candidatus Wolfebacteria bacterium]|nr:hypothetical protein [Candidatus Wolfebacteria bacterium]
MTIRNKNPPEFSSVWILRNSPSIYRFISKNVRSEIDQIDWDIVTVALIRRYQHRWMRYRRRPRKEYENQAEVEKIIGKYRDKLYVFIALSNDKEERLRHRITIALVRVAQKGNVLATKELVGHLRYIVDEWIDRYFFLRRWRGAESEIDEAIEGCIRRYRYTGTFFGYLFKTMEYSANALKPFYSLDGYLPETDMRLSEVIGQDAENGEIKTYG